MIEKKLGSKSPGITQMMDHLLLATEIQEEILYLPKTVAGHDPIKLRHFAGDDAGKRLGEAEGEVGRSERWSC